MGGGFRSVALALGLAAALAGCPEGPPPPKEDAGPPPIATVAAAQGTVMVERAGPPTQATAGAKLFSGDLVATGPSSSAVVRTPDGQELEASERTRFRLTVTGNKLVVQLLEGRLVTRAGDGGARALEVKAPGTQTELQMGDVIDITARGTGSTLKVTEGDIVLVTPDGGTQTVGAGQTAELEMGEIRIAQRPAPAAPASIAVTLASERGKTLLRPKGQRKFSPAGEGEVSMADGTAFQVGKGGRALLASKSGLKARLVAAGGLLESAVLEGVSERYTFGLDSGEVQLQFPGGAERKVTVKGGGKSLQVTASEATTATVVASRKGPKLVVTAGAVKVGEGDGALSVAPGQVVDLAAPGEPKVTALPRPPLVLPTRRVRVYADALPSVGLGVPEGAQTVQVAADKDFGQLLAEGRASGEYLPYPPPPQGELHWRAMGAGGAVVAKGTARFDRDPDASVEDIEHPHAEVTETGLKAVVYFQSVLPEITFVYPARDGAAQYRLRIFKADDLKEPIWQREEKDLHSTVPAGKIGEGSYLWYAAGLSAQGAELAGGRMNKLDMIYDNSRRSLAIARPRQGERVGKVVEASGIAPLGSKLTLNGRAATLDGKGRFKVSVPSTPFLVFRLVTDDGGESYWVRQVRSR